MQAEFKDRDIEECTFQPQIYSVEEGYQKRNLDQFLEDQNNFVRKITKKIEEVKTREQYAESMQYPNIDETSRKIVEEKLAEKRYNKPIHQRLYELNKEIQDKRSQQREIEDLKFRQQANSLMVSGPGSSEAGGVSISIQKRDNLDQILYEDAFRRLKDQARAKEELDRIRDVPLVKAYHNDKSDKYLMQRFVRELRAVQEEMILGKQRSPSK